MHWLQRTYIRWLSFRYSNWKKLSKEAFQGVWATSDIASKCGDNLLPKYRQPTEVDTKEATICENDNTFFISTKRQLHFFSSTATWLSYEFVQKNDSDNFLRWSGDKGTQKDATRRQDYPPWKASQKCLLFWDFTCKKVWTKHNYDVLTSF